MLNADLYPELSRRKSFHLFRGVGSGTISAEELAALEEAWRGFEPLYPGIRTAIRVVPASEFPFKRDAEYCVLIYSEQKENYLMNAGYLGEQLDLWLVSRGIGSLWYGLGKPDAAEYDGLGYVIMIAVRKVSDPSLFRKDVFKAKRKALSEIWEGETLPFSDLVRFAPSACNSQPWTVRNEAGRLTVFRYKKQAKIGIMSEKAAFYYNRIDIGIFLCFMEICMAKEGEARSRALFPDSVDAEYSKVAEYSPETA